MVWRRCPARGQEGHDRQTRADPNVSELVDCGAVQGDYRHSCTWVLASEGQHVGCVDVDRIPQHEDRGQAHVHHVEKSGNGDRLTA